MKKFFNVLLVTILLVVIVGGVGYIGYSYLFIDHTGMNMGTTQDSQANASDNNSQSMSGMNMGTTQDSQANASDNNSQSMSGMQNGSNAAQPAQNGQNQQSPVNNSLAINQSATILKNKERLDTALAGLNVTLEYLTLDPYGTSEMSGMESKNSATVPQDSVSSGSENTTVNIYPQNNNTVNVVPPNNTNNSPQPDSVSMQNMGTMYDAAKMEQLHAGLYNLSVGKAMLAQLDNNFVSQASNTNIKDPVQYYTDQYNLTLQNKMKLNSALNYINEAAGLVNINPYVSSQGLVYDQERMGQIHKSVFKLAESVVALNLLNDDLTTQTIQLANLAQNYAYNASNNMQMNNAPMSTGLFGGIFDNISMQSVVNIILILFVTGLIFGIFGFIFSLLKSPKKLRGTEKIQEEIV